MSQPYDFGDFLIRMTGKSDAEIIKEAEAEAGTVERLSHKVAGAVRRRELGSAKYVRQIGELLWFMRTGTMPASIDECDWQHYRMLAEALVERELWTPQALQQFGTNQPSGSR